MTILELKATLSALPLSERAELAQYLLHTLESVGIPADPMVETLDGFDDEPAPVLTEAQRSELERRVALVDEGKTVMSRWEDVEARILAGLRG
jgi:putative addiction module component (TIGR02574 family)